MARKPKLDNPFPWFDISPEVIQLVVMLYVRHLLSLRNVEDLAFERGIDIFGPMFASPNRSKGEPS
jgi:putative transposase